jgi:hypothetical protein
MVADDNQSQKGPRHRGTHIIGPHWRIHDGNGTSELAQHLLRGVKIRAIPQSIELDNKAQCLII